MKISHQNSHSNSKSGFTLIELLVVIAIIGLLSSIIITTMVSARKKALNAALFAEIRSLNQWILGYRASTGKYPGPDTVHSNTVLCRLTTNSNWTWPPSGTSSEAPFQQGMPHLYVTSQNNWMGCVSIGIENDPDNDELGYEMYFHTYFNGEADSERQSKMLASMLGRPEGEVGCEWFNDYTNSCYIQYFHPANE